MKHPNMLGRPFSEVWSEVYHEVEDQVARVRAGEATWNNALLLLLERSGFPEETYHSFSYSPLHNDAGAIEGMLCVVTEVTEQIIAGRRLETLRQLGMALGGADTAETIADAVCQVLRENKRDFPFAIGFVQGRGGFVGHACSPDAQPLLDQAWPDAPPEDGLIVDLDGSYPAGDWQKSPSQALVLPIPGAGGQSAFGHLVLGLNPYRRDDEAITDFARLIAGQISGALANVAALSAERQRAQMMWNHARDLMVVVDSEGKFRAVSPAWTRILGHEVDDVVGRPFDDFMVPEDRASSHGALSAALGTGDLTGYENRFFTKGGEPRTFSWHTATDDGLVYAYGRDVTDQNANAEMLARTEEALRQAQKMEAVGQLTGGIAHDFNNMLTGVIGSVDIMKRRLAAGRTDDLDRFMEAASSSAQRAASLTARLLAFSRRQSLDAKPVDVNALTRGLEDLLRRSVSENITLDILTADDLPLALADANQLESAMLNLVINARDAMPDGGQLTIETADALLDQAYAATRPDVAPGRYVMLAVSDNGVGMPVDVVAKAVEPFFSTKPTGQGTGLGLSMVYGFARQSGGHVQIYSRVGEGTSVKLYLPIAASEAVEEAAPSPRTTYVGDGQTVLLVEDDESVRLLVRKVLEELAYDGFEAANADDALPIIRSGRRIDLLISDVGLPGMSGRQLAEIVRAHRPELPILFVTGYAENAAIRAGFLGTGMSMITKPFAIETLSAKIAEMMR
jgi:PAS domain S-box-containing protein